MHYHCVFITPPM